MSDQTQAIIALQKTVGDLVVNNNERVNFMEQRANETLDSFEDRVYPGVYSTLPTLKPKSLLPCSEGDLCNALVGAVSYLHRFTGGGWVIFTAVSTDFQNQTDPSRGSNLVGAYNRYGSYLKTISDINQGKTIPIFQFVASDKQSAIEAGTDNNDRSAMLLDALNSEAKSIEFPRGVLNFETGVTPSADNVELRMSPGASLRAQSTLDTQLLRFRGRKNIRVLHATLDARYAKPLESGKVRDLLTFDDGCEDCFAFQPVTIGNFNAAQYNYQRARPDEFPDPFIGFNGDSGIFVSGSKRVVIAHPLGLFLTDVHIYTNNTPQPNEDCQIIGGFSIGCYTGIAQKRGIMGVHIDGHTARGCYYGFTTEGATGVRVPGKQTLMSKPRAIDCYYPFVLRWADYSALDTPFIKNMWGSETASSGAIWLQGSQYVSIKTPIILTDAQYPNWDGSAGTTTIPRAVAGVYLQSRTEGDVTDRPSMYNQIIGGSVSGFSNGIREADNGVDYTRVYDIDIAGATNRGSEVIFTGTHSIVRRADPTNQATLENGDVWHITPNALDYWRSIDGGTWYTGGVRADNYEVWYRNVHRIAKFEDAGLTLDRDAIAAGLFSVGRLRLRGGYIWVDATGKLRIKTGEPTSDTDGVVVGTQT